MQVKKSGVVKFKASVKTCFSVSMMINRGAYQAFLSFNLLTD